MQAPAEEDWPAARALASYTHQVSLQTQMRLTASGQPLGIVCFEHRHKRYAILTSSDALRARRAVAAAAVADEASLKTFLALRERKASQRDWERLQAVLFSAGLSVCPTSGSPVFDLASCTPELREALWAALEALQTAINDKAAGADFDAKLRALGPLVRAHMAPAPAEEPPLP